MERAAELVSCQRSQEGQLSRDPGSVLPHGGDHTPSAKERLMRSGSRVALIIMMACAVGVVRDLSPSVRAQDATPAARQRAGGSETVSARTLASGTMEVSAPGKGQFGLGRIVLAPGAGLAFNPTSPAEVLVYTAAGALTFRVDVPMTVSRRVEPGTPVPTEPEAIVADTEFTLRDGDSAF